MPRRIEAGSAWGVERRERSGRRRHWSVKTRIEWRPDWQGCSASRRVTLTPTLSHEYAGEGADLFTLPLPLAGEGWGEGGSSQQGL